ERPLHVSNRSSDCRGTIRGDVKLQGPRSKFLQRGKQSFDRVSNPDDVGPGLAFHIEDQSWLAVVPGCDLIVFQAIDGFADVLEFDRSTLAISDDCIAKSCGVEQLIIRADLKGISRTLDGPLRHGNAGRGDGLAYIFER